VVGDLIGEGEALERGVVGETPNLAAHLQALAEPGSVVIAPPRAGSSAICSGCRHSAGTRSRVWPSQSRPGRSNGCRRPRAASKRCGAAG
jgi:hypothetical protein